MKLTIKMIEKMIKNMRGNINTATDVTKYSAKLASQLLIHSEKTKRAMALVVGVRPKRAKPWSHKQNPSRQP